MPEIDRVLNQQAQVFGVDPALLDSITTSESKCTTETESKCTTETESKCTTETESKCTTETGSTTQQCTDNQQVMVLTKEAQQMDRCQQMLDAGIEAIDGKLRRSELIADKKEAKIEELELEAHKAAAKFNVEHEKHVKEQSALETELEAQSAKTMELASILAEKKTEHSRLEADRAQEAMEKQLEARRIADELAEKREQDRLFAERKMNELKAAEEEVTKKTTQLAVQQAKEVAELENKQKEMNIDVETCRKSMIELRRRHEMELQRLNENKAQLEKVAAETNMARQLNEMYMQKKLELEAQIRELDDKAEHERRVANDLNDVQACILQEVKTQQQDLAQNTAALHDHEQLLQQKREIRSNIECQAKQKLENDQLALQKAQELAVATEDQLRKVRSELERLTLEEEAAKKKALELEKGATIVVEEKTKVIDVFEHKKFETTEPVVSRINVGEHHVEVEESKTLTEKITEGVKSMF